MPNKKKKSATPAKDAYKAHKAKIKARKKEARGKKSVSTRRKVNSRNARKALARKYDRTRYRK